ncbi:protein IRX15-LIKE-like [Phoenix dactylifera]|uniref:Protein IRX15-LIKE-like n=1 Tax=Phoenix dactylifera TaxID=42345 RepID=A0A8B8ZM61_PHODC|nr:protein IRX15-LIKE-like [Phoenix dactylifera]
MKGINNAKLILLQSAKQAGGGGGAGGGSTAAPMLYLLGSHHRLWLIAFAFFFTFAALLAFVTTTTTPRDPGLSSSNQFARAPSSFRHNSRLPDPVFDALVNYAAASNSSGKMGDADLRTIAAVLRRRAPCKFLVFGLGHETPLWRALNHGGRTVFLDENEYYIAHLEGHLPGLEAYDIAYTTKAREMPDLIAASRRGRRGDCRPVQNLLFSNCRLALNDLPNALYDIPWDVILVDGPRGHASTSPGRMSAIFTAAVMARSAGPGPTDVLVHDYEREVERVCSEEFLCNENLVANTGQLAHFLIPCGNGATRDDFCANSTIAEAAQ